MTQLSIDYKSIDALKPRSNNPRTHSPKQIGQIARSIERFGFTNPVIIDDHDGIVAGHGRVLAARTLGMREVPVVRLGGMTEADIRAYVIADNRLAENAGWDRALLGLEFQYLSALDIDFDLTVTGFELPEIDILLDDLPLESGENNKPDPADQIPQVATGPAVTRPGDIWQIGDHRLICGDATQAETYTRLLSDAKATMVFTDPPYNVPIQGHVSGLGGIQHREFAMASGEMSQQQFTDFLSIVFGQLAAFSIDGSIHFQCMDWRHMNEILAAGSTAYTELKNLCVWVKNNGGMGSLYRSQHELVFVFKSGRSKHINNIELGRHGRNRSNVWSFPGVNSFGKQQTDLALHPTVKPVLLVAEAIRDCSHRGDIVLDAFAGSGTTLVAAQRTGRQGYGIEIDPLYCDVIIRRIQSLFKLEALHTASGQAFDGLAATCKAKEGCHATL